MPRLDHHLRLQDRLTPMEHALVLVMVRLINPVRAKVQPPLPPLTEADVTRELRQTLREQKESPRQREER